MWYGYFLPFPLAATTPRNIMCKTGISVNSNKTTSGEALSVKTKHQQLKTHTTCLKKQWWKSDVMIKLFTVDFVLQLQLIHSIKEILNRIQTSWHPKLPSGPRARGRWWKSAAFFFGSLLLGSSPGRSALQSAE